MDTSKCDECGATFRNGVVIYEVKVNLVRGWRGYFCAEHLFKWFHDTPRLQENAKVTITN